MEYRIEQDSIGKKKVPINAYYGIQSLRAKENFKISGRLVKKELVEAIVQIKKACAKTNCEAGVIPEEKARVIMCACDEILQGKYVEQFIIDSIQGGAGTSFNMNANEVIANIAIEKLGFNKGDYSIVHPNDMVNCAQSTNDVYPTAGKIALIRLIDGAKSALVNLHQAMVNKAECYKNVVKMGRTEMQDAVPVSFGQVFRAFASVVNRDIERFDQAIEQLSYINMGATAIGTSINASEFFVKNIVQNLSKITSLPLIQSKDLIDGTQNLDVFMHVSGVFKTCATNLIKISNDLRLMSSGPRTGFSEIILQPKQNGSSIMPGKVNPVIPEVINQIAFKVIGNDTTVMLAVQAGQLELNAFEPIIFHVLIDSLKMLTNGINVFVKECIEQIIVNEKACKEQLEKSVGIITVLCPIIGYEKSAYVAKKALRENKSVKDIILQENVLSKELLEEYLDVSKMIGNN